MSKRYNGRIMSCSDEDLGIPDSAGRHYVYVKKGKSKDKYDVNVITSIENFERDEKHTMPLQITDSGRMVYLDPKKLKAIRKGNLYPIPRFEANFGKWSGITRHPIKDIDKSKLTKTKKKIWRRHKFFVGKYYK